MTGPLRREVHAGPSALQQGLSARPKGQIYLRVAAATSPSHGLCRPPLSGSSRLRRRGLQSAAGARPRGARTHPLTPRGPAPLRLSVARGGTPGAVSAGRAHGAPRWRPSAFLASRSRESRKVCALRHAPLVSLLAGVALPRSEEATPLSGLGRAPAAEGAQGPRPRGWSAAAAPGVVGDARAQRGRPSPCQPTELRAGVRGSLG